MAMTITRMRSLIKAHGHLVLEGDESKSELMEALMHLRNHTYDRCQKPWLGTATIEGLIPDITDLYQTQHRTQKKVQNIDLRGRRV